MVLRDVFKVHDQNYNEFSLCKNMDYSLEYMTTTIGDGKTPYGPGKKADFIYAAASSAARTGGSITSSWGFIAGNKSTSLIF